MELEIVPARDETERAEAAARAAEVLLAGYHKAIPLDFPLISGDRSIRSLANNPYRNFQTAVDLMSSGRVKVRPLITHRFQLSRIAEAFDVVTHKEENDAIKVIIHP